LVSEGCPGYFGDRGHVGTVQPNLGLDELFGVRESYVEFTPDLLDDLAFNLSRSNANGMLVWGGLFLQAYEPTTAMAVGWYQDGRVAAVDHTFGRGKTRLIGTMVGAGYVAHADNCSSAVFADLLRFAGQEQHIACSDPQLKARLHDGAGGTYVWVANPTRRLRFTRLTFGKDWGPFSSCHTLWGNGETQPQVDVAQRTIALTAGARDVTVIELL
jgi:beta-galactosidase